LQETPHKLHLERSEVCAGMNGIQGEALYAVLMRTRKLCHSVYQHQYHLVWGTKYRRKYLKGFVPIEFKKILLTLVKKYPTLYFVAINTDRDHVHLQVEIAPDTSVAKVVQRLKWHTSIRLKKKFPFIAKMYLENSIWSVGYFSSTIGLNEEQVKKYIQYQGRQEIPRQTRLGFS
jgi:putative transposase